MVDPFCAACRLDCCDTRAGRPYGFDERNFAFCSAAARVPISVFIRRVAHSHPRLYPKIRPSRRVRDSRLSGVSGTFLAWDDPPFFGCVHACPPVLDRYRGSRRVPAILPSGTNEQRFRLADRHCGSRRWGVCVVPLA